ncbi:MAG: hypothetical protein KDA41_16345 [Planctomycetales bacterium]|nr:hypothetical protein [Planctomycetales bacterium]
MKPHPPKPDVAEKLANGRIMWGIFAAAIAWGLMIGVGAFLQQAARGAVVFAVVLTLAGLWAGLLFYFQRRRNAKR